MKIHTTFKYLWILQYEYVDRNINGQKERTLLSGILRYKSFNLIE